MIPQSSHNERPRPKAADSDVSTKAKTVDEVPQASPNHNAREQEKGRLSEAHWSIEKYLFAVLSKPLRVVDLTP